MNKSELWDELKSYLEKTVPSLYDMAFKAGYQIDEERLNNKARGMDLVLMKMNEYERDLLDKEPTIKNCLNCDNSWYHRSSTTTEKVCMYKNHDEQECKSNNFQYYTTKITCK